MIVLSDASPINYLVLIGQIDILPALFDEVAIPTAVFAELQHPGAPEAVSQWIRDLPGWLHVHTPAHVDPQIRLGQGEAQAISLAVEMHATLLLMDDLRGRREAEARGLSVAGTLNVLEAAAQRDLLDLPAAIGTQAASNEFSYCRTDHSESARGRGGPQKQETRPVEFRVPVPRGRRPFCTLRYFGRC